jgi:NAD(P)-dependent dehydrogenase (short-subunit alcohol dehydrogenase family)
MKHVVILGHRGALGQSIEKIFLANGWKGYGVDPRNPKQNGGDGKRHISPITGVSSIDDIPLSQKLDAIVCVAGGFELNPTYESKETLHTQLSRLWAMNVEPSVRAAELFAKQQNHHDSSALTTLIVTGSRVVQENKTGVPWAIAYGMCKAAVHQLAQTIFVDPAEKPLNRVVCLMPTMLDTPANRASMPNEDFTKWTPTDVVGEAVFELCNGGTPKRYNPKSVFYIV